MAREFLTDDQVELEIDRLLESDAVKLAKEEQRIKYRRRQYLYQLRWYEKRGKQLQKDGVTFESLHDMDVDLDED
jgi:hypothetical protein